MSGDSPNFCRMTQCLADSNNSEIEVAYYIEKPLYLCIFVLNQKNNDAYQLRVIISMLLISTERPVAGLSTETRKVAVPSRSRLSAFTIAV